MKKSNNSFLSQILGSLAHGFMMLIFAFSIGTGASALVCWYYGLPLVLSLIGGFIVLGLAVVVMTDTPFL